ncbi:MAG: alpha/beta hydrolase [Zoogloea sp.]|nr:alpha/beta hydrolase [Zoogloea sp.]
MSGADAVDVFVVPGLHGSGPAHWQSRWQTVRPGWQRVEQADWTVPDLERWAETLAETVAGASRPLVLVAHSFGCLTTMRAWQRFGLPVAGALLVAPANPAKFGVEDLLPKEQTGVPTVLVASRNDPWMPFDVALEWAERWGAEAVDLGFAGHINVDSGHGAWPQGLALADELLQAIRKQPHVPA